MERKELTMVVSKRVEAGVGESIAGYRAKVEDGVFYVLETETTFLDPTIGREFKVYFRDADESRSMLWPEATSLRAALNVIRDDARARMGLVVGFDFSLTTEE
jgi:hypothetical protein